jgi:hypothetical protein
MVHVRTTGPAGALIRVLDGPRAEAVPCVP